MEPSAHYVLGAVLGTRDLAVNQTKFLTMCSLSWLGDADKKVQHLTTHPIRG